MNKIIVLAFVTTIGLFGCSTTQEPTFIGETVEIESSELNQYWMHDSKAAR